MNNVEANCFSHNNCNIEIFPDFIPIISIDQIKTKLHHYINFNIKDDKSFSFNNSNNKYNKQHHQYNTTIHNDMCKYETWQWFHCILFAVKYHHHRTNIFCNNRKRKRNNE